MRVAPYFNLSALGHCVCQCTQVWQSMCLEIITNLVYHSKIFTILSYILLPCTYSTRYCTGITHTHQPITRAFTLRLSNFNLDIYLQHSASAQGKCQTPSANVQVLQNRSRSGSPESGPSSLRNLRIRMSQTLKGLRYKSAQAIAGMLGAGFLGEWEIIGDRIIYTILKKRQNSQSQIHQRLSRAAPVLANVYQTVIWEML